MMTHHGPGRDDRVPLTEEPEFTVEALISVLRRTLKGHGTNPTFPNPKDPGLAPLVHTINRLRAIDAGRQGWLREHLDECKRFAQALRTLHDLAPAQRRILTTDVKMASVAVEKYGKEFELFLGETEANLAAFDSVIDAADRAMERGLPIADIESIAPDPRGEHTERFRWRGFAPLLEKAFCAALPARTKRDTYRFVEGIMPQITGDRPTFENIQEHLKSLSRAK